MDFTRQFQHLRILGNEIIRQDGVFSNGQFYQKLEEYIRFYDEIRPMLKETFGSDIFINEKVSSLPELIFEDYDNPLSVMTALYTLLGIVFFPAGLIYLFRKYRYVSGIKATLREIDGSFSSIEFLAKVEK